MTHKVTLSPEAIGDFQALYDYLSPLAGERTAAAYVGKLYAYCMDLRTFPQRGMRRDDLRPGLRIVGYRRKASIAFRVDGDVVTIVRVFHGGQDIAFEDDVQN
ncbi:type II toxin-antitoxin system RelE/ParE family toxin [Mesorhizobium sp. LHD-90]|uniref:type II toxin-antitoxin system RelE/ParE family toxin n=1 Tax=Mesorhizobium sp. LHD-90 TaxID=3071414 RepID=UPI0027E1A5C0|nr:type II toxin-antitoxin system RelE/ParE family toxin [Mesorhizobium sp. LHD-90]MDQ6437112.1 type II toxin-antitoxin system RelE/ParE family toxin [Mesorhizobium sp. LHD-90]